MSICRSASVPVLPDIADGRQANQRGRKARPIVASLGAKSKCVGSAERRAGRSASLGSSVAAPPHRGAAEKGLKLGYAVGAGNNSLLVWQLLRRRPGWTSEGPRSTVVHGGGTVANLRVAPSPAHVPLSSQPMETQFLWMQYAHQDFLEAMAAKRDGVHMSPDENGLMVMTRLNGSVLDGCGGASTIPRVHNHFECSNALATKCDLRDNLVAYYLRKGQDPFLGMPMTFVIHEGSGDSQFAEWERAFHEIQAASGQKVWLVKPGGNAKRGSGIRIYDSVEDVAARVDDPEPGKFEGQHESDRRWVVQKYIEKPLLIHRRKFDLRAFCLVAQECDSVSAYYFAGGGYVKTVSAPFTLKSFDPLVHLTNGPVQAQGKDFNKFEPGNKMSFDELQTYLNRHHSEDKVSVNDHIVPQIRQLMIDAVTATANLLNPRGIQHCFEIFGFDFMIDASYRVLLLEVNVNPSLELCNSYLSQLIPRMLDGALRLTLDRVFANQLAAAVNGGSAGAAAKGGGRGWELLCTV